MVYEENKESVRRKWAPDAGALMNAANAFSRSWKHDFYGKKGQAVEDQTEV